MLRAEFLCQSILLLYFFSPNIAYSEDRLALRDNIKKANLIFVGTPVREADFKKAGFREDRIVTFKVSDAFKGAAGKTQDIIFLQAAPLFPGTITEDLFNGPDVADSFRDALGGDEWLVFARKTGSYFVTADSYGLGPAQISSVAEKVDYLRKFFKKSRKSSVDVNPDDKIPSTKANRKH
jgi:hypothetical protein